jgi:HEAT repeat protein
MDGRTSAAVACAVAGSTWVLLGLALLARRLRFTVRSMSPVDQLPVRLPPERAGHYGWSGGLPRAHAPVGGAEADDPEMRARVLRALRGDEPQVRRASVSTLGRLGKTHDWAIDGLIEALAEGRDTPARVAAQLDRLVPRVGTRLTPLLGHPSSIVRFYAVRLLARYGELGRRLVTELTRDPSPNVRAAALETLRTVATGDALRSALQLVDDPHPQVRAHACRTACSISGVTAAPFVVPLLGDEFWEVREAARKSLVGVGGEVVPTLRPALGSEDECVRSGAALVLQDVGIVDELLSDGSDPGLLEQILAAGGSRFRSSAAERARRGRTVRRPGRPLPSGAGGS